MSAAAKAGRKPAKASGKAGASKWSAGLGWAAVACVGLVVLAPGSMILLAVLLVPALLLAVVPGRHGGGRAMQASLLFGAAACVHPLHLLWMGDTSVRAAIALLRLPMLLPTGWIALLGGWLVSEVAVGVLRIHADIVAAGLRRQMIEQITVIEDEWGPMPASAPLPPL